MRKPKRVFWLSKSLNKTEANKLPSRNVEADLRSPYNGARQAIWQANTAPRRTGELTA